MAVENGAILSTLFPFVMQRGQDKWSIVWERKMQYREIRENMLIIGWSAIMTRLIVIMWSTASLSANNDMNVIN